MAKKNIAGLNRTSRNPVWRKKSLVVGISIALHAGATIAAANEMADSGGATATKSSGGSVLEEVFVTARKRDERISDVPVAVYALGAKDLQVYGVSDIVSASAFTPGLTVSRSMNNGAAQIYMRGVGTSVSSVAFDQAVAINIDNIAVSKGRAIFQSYFDMQQMEVLRGPQALFFGKNSTAGVISVSTANPTKKPEFLARVGYEFEGKESIGEFVASGPISDTTGLRVALRGSNMEGGYFKNVGPELNGVSRNTDSPQEKEMAGRVTLVYKPSDKFDLNAKISFSHLKNDGVNGYSQMVNCQGPGGTPQPIFGVPNLSDGCKLDKKTSEVALDPAIAAHFPDSHGGKPYNENDNQLGALSAYFHLGDYDFTSVTGYYKYKSGPSFGDFVLGSSSQIFGNEFMDYTALTQEFRLASQFSGPFNYTVGLFFDDTKLKHTRAVRLFTAPPDPATGRTDQWHSGGNSKGSTYSAFTELTYQITPQLDISGGARYSHEKKDSVLETFFASASTGLPFITSPINDRFEGSNTSPQVTLRWRPDGETTLFASYKEGYKSGGSNIGEIPFLGTTAKTLHYESELAQGGEAGIKGRMLDGALSYGVTLYRYTFDNLQVSVYDPVTVSLHVGNAGKYRTQGMELDWAYTVPMENNLRFRGSAYYNDAKYLTYVGPCYTGQSIGQGCNLPNLQQDYEGKPGTHAPKWTLSLGTDYDFPILDSGLRMGFSADARYMSSYYVGETLSPFQKQGAYVNVDATVRLFNKKDGWEVALIGRNLADKLIGGNAIEITGTGSGTGTNSAVPADTYLVTGKPRTILLQATMRW